MINVLLFPVFRNSAPPEFTNNLLQKGSSEKRCRWQKLKAAEITNGMGQGEGLMFMALPLLQRSDYCLWRAMVCKRRFTFRDIRLCLRQWLQS